MDGLEVARRWRRVDRRTPIVMFTADMLAFRRIQSNHGPANAWLRKPLRTPELLDVLVQLELVVYEARGRVRPARAKKGFGMPKEVVDAFAASSEGEVRAIEEAAAARDWATVRRVAHALGGSARVVGADELGELCTRIERDTDSDDALDAIERLPHLREQSVTRLFARSEREGGAGGAEETISSEAS